MTGQTHEQRRWTRYSSNNQVRYTANGKSRNGRLRDISAGGAAFDLEGPDDDEDRGLLAVDELGAYETQLIRDMNDGFAVMLSLDDGEQLALHEELSEYFHKDDQGFD